MTASSHLFGARRRRRTRALGIALRERARIERVERGVVQEALVASPFLRARRSARRAGRIGLAGGRFPAALLKRAHLAIVLGSHAVARDARRTRVCAGSVRDQAAGPGGPGATVRAAVGGAGRRGDQSQRNADPDEASNHRRAPALAKSSREVPSWALFRCTRRAEAPHRRNSAICRGRAGPEKTASGRTATTGRQGARSASPWPLAHPVRGQSGGFARDASCNACCGNQAPAAGSTRPHRGSKVAWSLAVVGHPGCV